MTYANLKHKARILLNPLVTLFAKLRIHPSALTITGFLLSCLVAALFAYDFFRWAGIALIIASLFDAIDGAVARKNNLVSDIGAFLDSTIDRFSEFAVFLGIFIHYIRIENWFFIFVTLFALFGSSMVSYTRAKAEALGLKGEIGLFTRAERVVVLALGLLLSQIDYALITALAIIVVFSFITVSQRLVYVWQQTRIR